MVFVEGLKYKYSTAQYRNTNGYLEKKKVLLEH